ncbi:hypothetical protein D3273_22165 [Lichenibacterium minor]|uniref:Uncharacterized protein n=1 Tax=Lichenibacterium minor TaxID=2316528 RepID=A0A4Q2U482_9HYPH|nr:hypothetical protein [Lichenibacterium minor]RYC29771.1 hypothetical protein D3273_22165 [Lichenibacterium minor]
MAEALLVYEEVLALTEDERTAFETGHLMHRIGGCALDLDDGQYAFVSHIDAGRQARDVGLRRLCAESLTAAGWSLATHLVATPGAATVDRDLVATGFDGVLDEAREVLLVDGKPSFDRVLTSIPTSPGS